MRKIISLVLIQFMFLSVLISLASCNPERNETYTKEITTQDVILDKSSDSINIAFIVRPQVDVDDLMITIGFYDKNDYPVRAGTKKIGKVIAGQEYHIEFNDFSYKELLAISKYKFLDADGTMRIEQDTKGFCSKHNYDDGFTSKEAKCGCLGEMLYTCQNCGYKKSEMIPYIEHNWVDNKYGDMNFICTKCCVQCDWED